MDEARAFDAFVRAHATDLLRAATLTSGSRERGEELLQDTLTNLYPQWDKVVAADVPIAYVRRALMNRLISAGRSSGSRHVTLWDLPERWDGNDMSEAIATRRVIWQLLGALPDRQRVALVLRYFNDLADAQIAKVLGCREATVRSIISRALAALRRDLAVASITGKAASE
ncbi:MAG TPA: sigma-70 family RNA polymerase sigma factor [Jatrophihabitantaceae bacterium]